MEIVVVLLAALVAMAVVALIVLGNISSAKSSRLRELEEELAAARCEKKALEEQIARTGEQRSKYILEAAQWSAAFRKVEKQLKELVEQMPIEATMAEYQAMIQRAREASEAILRPR